MPAILHLETASAYILEILQEQSIHARSRSTENFGVCAPTSQCSKTLSTKLSGQRDIDIGFRSQLKSTVAIYRQKERETTIFSALTEENLDTAHFASLPQSMSAKARIVYGELCTASMRVLASRDVNSFAVTAISLYADIVQTIQRWDLDPFGLSKQVEKHSCMANTSV